MKYLQITQDGICRIIFDKTPSEISGLFTDSLETCIAIIICAENGVTLIHDTGRLATEAIFNEYNLLHNVTSWAIVYNPSGGEDWKGEVKRFTSILFNKCSNFQTYSCKSGCVMVDRSGKVQVNFTLTFNDELLSTELDKRMRVNLLNNLFLLDNEAMMPDLQYDGEKALPSPALRKNVSEMYSLLQRPKFKQHYPQCFGNLANCILIYYPERYDELMECRSNNDFCHSLLPKIRNNALSHILHSKIYTTTDIAIAFRRAAGFGHSEHLALMFEHKPDIINSKGTSSGRTALHAAVLKGQVKNIKFLLQHGADRTLRDNKGNSAVDYAEQKNDTSLMQLFTTSNSSIETNKFS